MKDDKMHNEKWSAMHLSSADSVLQLDGMKLYSDDSM